MREAHEEILRFWFGELDSDGRSGVEHAERWWKKDPAFDAELRERFLPLHTAIASGAHESWRDSARPCIAYVVVLDQLSRNMFRGTRCLRTVLLQERDLPSRSRSIAPRGFGRGTPSSSQSSVKKRSLFARSAPEETDHFSMRPSNAAEHPTRAEGLAQNSRGRLREAGAPPAEAG